MKVKGLKTDDGNDDSTHSRSEFVDVCLWVFLPPFSVQSFVIFKCNDPKSCAPHLNDFDDLLTTHARGLEAVRNYGFGLVETG